MRLSLRRSEISSPINVVTIQVSMPKSDYKSESGQTSRLRH